jgi:hypothetical protein
MKPVASTIAIAIPTLISSWFNLGHMAYVTALCIMIFFFPFQHTNGMLRCNKRPPFHLRLGLPNDRIPSSMQFKASCKKLFSQLLSVYSAHLNW